MEYALVVFDANEDGEKGLFTPYLKNQHLYVNLTEATPKFIWVHISGDITVPKGVALRSGWRAAGDPDKSSWPLRVTYYPNS